MELIEALSTSGSEITFGALFIALLYYVMKTNDKREEQYRATITTLSLALQGYEDLKSSIIQIQDKLNSFPLK